MTDIKEQCHKWVYIDETHRVCEICRETELQIMGRGNREWVKWKCLHKETRVVEEFGKKNKQVTYCKVCENIVETLLI